jgi:hypothetical protein
MVRGHLLREDLRMDCSSATRASRLVVLLLLTSGCAAWATEPPPSDVTDPAAPSPDPDDEPSLSRTPRIVRLILEPIGGLEGAVIGTTLGIIGGSAALAFVAESCDFGACVILGFPVGLLVGDLIGVPLGVFITGARLGGGGSFLATLGGAAAGVAVGAIGVLAISPSPGRIGMTPPSGRSSPARSAWWGSPSR